MYLPASFAETDRQRLHTFLREQSFATLVTEGPEGPQASRLPLLLDAERGELGVLIGHFARANTQWVTADQRPALAIFDGPHAYISPAWYGEEQVVPTWNYVTVHASGRLRIIDDDAWLTAQLRRMVDEYEESREEPWTMDSQSEDFLSRLKQGVVGFEIPIAHLEGKWKLSQNHSRERRRKVIDRLRQAPDVDAHRIAELMAAALSETGESM